MRSETIADKIMTEAYEEVKTLISDTIPNHRTVNFGEIEEKVSELSNRFSKRLSDGVLEAIGNGYVGRTIECECGEVLEYRDDYSWLSGLIGK